MTYEQIHNLFKQRYNQNNWKQFLGEAFAKSRLLATPETLTGIDSNVASQVQKLGYITLNENGIERQIAVYDVTLAQGIILERNRVGLRNLLRKYWKDIDAAFITYHNNEKGNWRFTYVSELTGYDADGEFVKIKTEPKRYTYVLGEGESTRTAAERFTAIANKGSKATLDDVKEAFSVEKLSKAFFDEYKKHYDIFCDYMVSKPNIRQTIFHGDEKGIRDFNKKLLGRIVFLYFIQKKGWLGVPAKSDWGKGDFDFLTNLFKNTKNPDLFYSELLSKLFFDTLNTKRKDDLIELVKGEPCRIPYLNGGLFEEDDKKHRNLIFPANLFKSLFDFFNQYNFTIYEDDPNDHTVAVDPEMLGHIFENLLEDNKDKGAYYTPKEIVHYMCQESLIEYLTTWFENKGYEVVGYIGFDKPDQPKLFSANEGRKGQLVIETDNKTSGKQIDRILIEKLLKKKLDDEDKKLIKKHSAEFHNALDSVKICDPAIGSGAFPMGLLHEIFTAKQTLHTFEHGNTKTFDASGVKLNIIQNSIYGVDIEKGAVDIARLRFWLSLIVDEEKPKALPNLDYKIVVGNSLVSKLGNDIIDIEWEVKATSDSAKKLQAEIQKNLTKLFDRQKIYFNYEGDKEKLQLEIRNLKVDLLISQLNLDKYKYSEKNAVSGSLFDLTAKEKTAEAERKIKIAGFDKSIRELHKLKDKPEKPLHFFDWKLDFPEVMNESVSDKTGFDIVIANPPYVNIANISDEVYRSYIQANYKTVKNKSDLYSVFIEKAHFLSKENAIICFIYPKTWMGSDSFSKYREFITNNFRIHNIINLGYGIFENATVSTVITVFSKLSISSHDILLFQLERNEKGQINFIQQDNKLPYSQIKSTPQFLFSFTKAVTLNIKTKPLKELVDFSLGIKTSDDKKFIIDYKKDDSTYLMLRGKNIRKYEHDKPSEYIWYKPNLMMKKVGAGPRKLEYFLKDKILIQGICNGVLRCSYDSKKYLVNDKVHIAFNPKDYSLKVILAILNSTLMSFISKSMFGNYLEIKINQLELLPFPVTIQKSKENAIAVVVNERLNCKNQNETTKLELTIDNLVYKLYELTYDEVKVIDPEFSLSKKEYEAIKLE